MLRYSKYYGYDDGQYLFDRTLHGLLFFICLLLKALIYSPYLIAAYFIEFTLLNPKSSGLIWISTILLIAYILHGLTRLLLAKMVHLKVKRSKLWLPLFFVMLFFTCVLPVWILWSITNPFFHRFQEGTILRYLLAFSFAFYLFKRHSFLYFITK